MYKTTEAQRKYQREHYQKNIENYRKYKQNQMKQRRANPEINENTYQSKSYSFLSNIL